MAPRGELYAVDPNDSSSSLSVGNVGTGNVPGYVFPRFGTADVLLSSASDAQSMDTVLRSLNGSYPLSAPSTPVQIPWTNDVYMGGSDGKLHYLSTLAPGGPGTTTCIGDCSSTTVGSPTYDVIRQMLYVGTIDGETKGVKTPF